MEEANPQKMTTNEVKLQFLTSQITYLTSHLQIADTKAAGLVAYISLLMGFTVGNLDLSRSACITPNEWLGLTSLGIGGVGIVLALWAILPRAWPGNIPDDTFSWVGIAAHAEADPYTKRIAKLTFDDMEQSLADTIEYVSLIIRKKYRIVYVAILVSFVASLGIALFWLELISDRCN